MKESISTQLRYISAKDPKIILAWVNHLPYKIEIKGAPIFAKGRWYLYFVMPDVAQQEVPSGQLD